MTPSSAAQIADQPAHAGRTAGSSESDENKFGSLTGLLVRKGEAGPSVIAAPGAASPPPQSEEELRSLRAALALRESELEQARLTREQVVARAAEEAQASLRGAEQNWRAGEEARFAAAQAEWRKQSQTQLAQATARYEAAEGVLSHMRQEATRQRSEPPPAADPFAQLRAATPSVERRQRSSRSPTRTQFNNLRNAPQAQEEDEEPRPSGKKGLRDFCIVVAFAVAVFTLYPNVAPYLPYSWRYNIAQFTGGFGLPSAAASVSAPAAKAVVVSDVNLRVGPSTQSKIVTALSGGMKVMAGEKRDGWTAVRVESTKPNAKPLQGWVSSAYIKEEADETAGLKAQ